MSYAPSVARSDTTPRTELRARADGIAAELGRLTEAWHAGRAPSADALYALADDLGALRDALGSATVASDAPADRLVG